MTIWSRPHEQNCCHINKVETFQKSIQNQFGPVNVGPTLYEQEASKTFWQMNKQGALWLSG